MGQILLISTPFDDNDLHIALTDEKLLTRNWETDREWEINRILTIAESFWELVWGIIWGITVKSDFINCRTCSSVRVTQDVDYSILNSHSFPNEWGEKDIKEYIAKEILRILQLSESNRLHLQQRNRWTKI